DHARALIPRHQRITSMSKSKLKEKFLNAASFNCRGTVRPPNDSMHVGDKLSPLLRSVRDLPKFRQELLVGLVLLQRRDEGFHRFDWIQVHHRPAQFADRFDMLAVEKFLLFARPALRNVDGRK